MKKLLLIGILLIGIFFRFYKLGVNPPSLTWDEAAWGYNAYTLGIDGRDEFGRLLPYDYLESFGDYKPPVYAYVDIIPVKLFGLTPFSTRFPSAAFGVLTIFITYLLVRRIFPKSKHKELYALLAALVLAISPWHILLSRAAFEANVASFFIITGVWLFLCGVQEKKWLLIPSLMSFVLSLYTFNSSRVVAPLLGFALVCIFWKQLLERKKEFIVAFVISLIIIAPTIKFLLSPQNAIRFQEVNIFTDSSIVQTSNQEVTNDNNSLWSKMIHNRRVLFTFDFLHHYFDNLDTQFLFIKGDGNPKFSIQDVGEMYLWDIVFFIIGIVLLIRKKEGSYLVIFVWLLLGIIPAATARETPHALRTEVTLPTFQIFVAYGIAQAIIYSKKITQFKWIWFGIFVLLFFNVLYFTHSYFVHYPTQYSQEWQYGYDQSIAYVQQQQNNYDQIYMTQGLGRPYIYFLFNMKEDPRIFRKTAIIQRDSFGFVHVNAYGKYIFDKQLALQSQTTRKTLFIDQPGDVPARAQIVKQFYYLDGTVSLVAYKL